VGLWALAAGASNSATHRQARAVARTVIADAIYNFRAANRFKQRL